MAQEPNEGRQQERNEERQSERPRRPFQEASFFRIVETFGMGALISTGVIQNPVEKGAKPDFEMAKYQIGLLEILEDRTRGNLKEDEAKFLEEWLHQVRLAYVQAVRRQEQESQKPGEAPASGEGEKKEE
jgi:hypothetical protein